MLFLDLDHGRKYINIQIIIIIIIIIIMCRFGKVSSRVACAGLRAGVRGYRGGLSGSQLV